MKKGNPEGSNGLSTTSELRGRKKIWGGDTRGHKYDPPYLKCKDGIRDASCARGKKNLEKES